MPSWPRSGAQRRWPCERTAHYQALYRVTYCDGIEGPDGMCPRPDPACTEMSVRVYAYNEEHALEKVDSPDEGWVALSATRERA